MAQVFYSLIASTFHVIHQEFCYQHDICSKRIGGWHQGRRRAYNHLRACNCRPDMCNIPKSKHGPNWQSHERKCNICFTGQPENQDHKDTNQEIWIQAVRTDTRTAPTCRTRERWAGVQ